MSNNEKLSVSELLRRACLYAERDQQGFLEAMDGCGDKPGTSDYDATRDAEQFIRQVRAYRLKRWGKSRCDELREALEECVPVSPEEVARGGDREFGAPQ